MKVYLPSLIVEVGLEDYILLRRGGKIYLILGQKRNVAHIDSLMALLGKWGRIFRLPFGMIFG